MNSSFNVQDAGFNIGVNVRVRKLDKRTGREIERREGHNRCLKYQLMGIVKWMNGEFNNTQPYLVHYDWIPRYLGVGTNIASGLTPAGISSEVTVNDTRLLNEIMPHDQKRIKLPERNKIINRSTQDYIQLVIVTYLPEEEFLDQSIAEAGLFSKETGNNCLFRITFDPIRKTEDTVVEVNWTITVISLESTGEPYSEIDKVDLRQMMNQLLDRFGELRPDIKDACDHVKTPGIYDYGRLDASQIEVDSATQLLAADLKAIENLSPTGTGGTDTSDGDVVSDDIAMNKIAYAKGLKVIGSAYDYTAVDNVTLTDVTNSPYPRLYKNGNDIYLSQNETSIFRKGNIINLNENKRLANLLNIDADTIVQGTNILGIEGKATAGIDTSDATAIADEILQGKTAYADGNKLTGTMFEYNQINIQEPLDQGDLGEGTFTNDKGTFDILTVSGTFNIDKKAAISEHTIINMSIDKAELATYLGLTADKIKKGENILGIEGTYEGDYTQTLTPTEYTDAVDTAKIIKGDET